MSDSETNPDEYIVEKVLRVRIRSGVKEYFLKWKGYPDSENSWEPEANLDCPELIKQFEENAKKGMTKIRSGRASSVASSDAGSVKLNETTKNEPNSSTTTTTTGAEPENPVKDTAESTSSTRTRKRRTGTTEPESEDGKPSDENLKESEAAEIPLEEDSTPPKRQALSEIPGSTQKARGFERNLNVERIIGATESAGELMFLIKWQGLDVADLVPAKEANVRCPQSVIKFYEERLTWHTPENNQTSNMS
ncbi:unnamed protein product [Rodentolepis nana]|uniref:Chromo domain-containing protein n=1 Tax=Rodentolepis nana TaxID=102285 RepID=A0A0R3T5F8_RODNA|nr:unnamed protein product [Rodentolepis nana]